MTEQEAIKSMKNLNLVLSITDSERESVNMAIKALEKQIPKKPLENIVGFYCSNCKRFVESVHYYCGHCGQKIEWSEQE